MNARTLVVTDLDLRGTRQLRLRAGRPDRHAAVIALHRLHAGADEEHAMRLDIETMARLTSGARPV